MKSYVKFAWIGHMDWINYKYVNVETALNQYQLVRNICHKCDQPYAALNGSSWVVQKSTACNFLYSSNKNSNETLLTAVASWIHWKFEFFIFLPARRSPSEILLFQFNFVDAETQSLPTHKKIVLRHFWLRFAVQMAYSMVSISFHWESTATTKAALAPQKNRTACVIIYSSICKYFPYRNVCTLRKHQTPAKVPPQCMFLSRMISKEKK